MGECAGADVKRYVSTVIIIVNHVQTLTIIGEMRLEWPLLAKQIMAALSLLGLLLSPTFQWQRPAERMERMEVARLLDE